MEAVGRLTAGIAHDFNNVLLVITGNLKLLDLQLNQHDLIPTKQSLDMTARLYPALLGCIAVLLATVGGSAQNERNGRALAENLCAGCHMNEGQGEKQGPMGVPGFRAIANRPNQSVEGILAWLKSVPPMMPNHHLTQDEIHDLANFILSLRRAAETSPQRRG